MPNWNCWKQYVSPTTLWAELIPVEPVIQSGWYLVCQGVWFSYTTALGITGEKSVGFWPCLNVLSSSGNLCPSSCIRTVCRALDLGDTGLNGRELALHGAWMDRWIEAFSHRKASPTRSNFHAKSSMRLVHVWGADTPHTVVTLRVTFCKRGLSQKAGQDHCTWESEARYTHRNFLACPAR